MSYLSFHLSDEFVRPYARKQPDWGFSTGSGNTLGELTFLVKYSRLKPDGSKERWDETCRRCVEGMYSILKDHCRYQRTPWNEPKAQRSAQDAFERMFTFRWTPPGRGLANMGTPMVHEDRSLATLINCAAVSTAKISNSSVYEAVTPFARLMDMTMHGQGVGFDTLGAGKLELHQPTDETVTWQITDDREGWVHSLELLLESFFFVGRPTQAFDYSVIRPEGSPLRRYGGTASGPGPLRATHDKLRELLGNREGERLTSRDIVDIMNLMGKAVVAGGARRSALLSLGNPTDTDFIQLKDWSRPENTERTGPDGWAWTSNNSVVASEDTDVDHLAQLIAVNGEPGVVWQDVVSSRGRLDDLSPDSATLVNPCAEIPLEPHELCCLAELYPSRHESLEDLQRSLKHAYTYAKAVTLLPSPWPETNEVITRNRRIGVSMTGLAQLVESRGWQTARTWLDESYQAVRALDRKYSSWLGVRESVRLTTVKPAGSTSLLAGTTPGVHFPTCAGYFLRRLRLLRSNPLVPVLEAAGYHVEADRNDPTMTVVVALVTKGLDMRSERDVSVWEKAQLAVLAQRWWADNAVSVTLSFDGKREADQVAPILRSMRGQLKTMSFLPIDADGTVYQQAPYEPLDQEVAERMIGEVKPLNRKLLYGKGLEAAGERFCTTDTCEVA